MDDLEHDFELHVGAEVYWQDPNEGERSGYCEIVEFLSDTVVKLISSSGTEFEAFVKELK